MSELKIGDQAPDFTLPGNNRQTISLSDYIGKPLVLYFYPKDNTPGCTQESCDFRDNLAAFQKLGCAVIGISKCSAKKHDHFAAKYDLNFPLASDENGDTCERYGVWKGKSLYGRSFMGIERSTFLIDKDGKIAAIWRKVKVKGHVEEVKNALEELKKKAA